MTLPHRVKSKAHALQKLRLGVGSAHSRQVNRVRSAVKLVYVNFNL